MIYLQMNQNERKTCPFVSPKGCLVYEDRPSACRIYPVARASRQLRAHNLVLENYFILHEDHAWASRRGDSGKWTNGSKTRDSSTTGNTMISGWG